MILLCPFCEDFLVFVDTEDEIGRKCPKGCYVDIGFKHAVTTEALDQSFKIDKANVEVKTITIGYGYSDGGPISEEAKREIERLAEEE